MCHHGEERIDQAHIAKEMEEVQVGEGIRDE